MTDGSSVVATFLVFLVCLAFAGVGGYLFWSQQQAIETHERTSGTIESSSVHEEVSERDTDDDGILEEDTSYYAQVTYNYTYGGERYQSSNVFPGTGEPSVDAARAADIVDEHPPDSDAVVYVDPSNPSSAYLIQERNLILPVGFMLLGGVPTILSGYTLLVRIFVGSGDET